MRQLKEIVLSPTDFVAIANQIFEGALGLVKIEGELANFKISKNKWVYFDIKDDVSKVACFANMYSLPGPLKDGMLVKIVGQPRLHQKFGFSINIRSIQPSGEGSIKKAYDLLKAKLQKEGLFAEERKRVLPYPPKKIALVTSIESAAYGDFIKIINARWPFLKLVVYETQVQGDDAPRQLMSAISQANDELELSDVLVIIRGGGSADDLSAFDDEKVVRAISKSRTPTLVAIGHEINVSLSELAADKRASTPSNAAELLTPDRKSEINSINQLRIQMTNYFEELYKKENTVLQELRESLIDKLKCVYQEEITNILNYKQLLQAFDPERILKRGYAVVRNQKGLVVMSVKNVKEKDLIVVGLQDGKLNTTVKSVHAKLK
jgi:exodeoxyribonuclease VII large subunit